MGIFLPGKRATNRRFSYEPRFYDPRKEESIKRRMRIQGRARRRRGPAGAVYFAILLLLALYLYTSL